MQSPDDLILKNVSLPGGRVADIAIQDGLVRHVGKGGRTDESIDCRGMLCLPGALDMHVHMRDGPQAYKEDWRSGSRSAIAGGVTFVVDQPNTVPPITSRSRLKDRIDEAMATCRCRFAVNAGVTAHADLEGMWQQGAMAFGEIFAAPSSYGDAIGPADLEMAVHRIARFGALITLHAETVDKGKDDSLAAHHALRSPEGEAKAVEGLSRMASAAGPVRPHFCHLSCGRSIDAARGTVEVTPHHLFLSIEELEAADGRGKVNPPVRPEKYRRELWARWERIDVVASDHAPHAIEEKEGDFAGVPSGIPGVETMVPLLIAQVLAKSIPLQSVIEKTALKPAKILGVAPAGFNIGNRADFALYTPVVTRIDPDDLHSKAGWTPFEGMDAVFPRTVIIGGCPVYHEGEFLDSRGEWVPGRGYI